MTAISYAVAANTGLTGDEAYYRLWSLAPALSYLDHPPFIAWIIACGRWFGGDTPLGVRFLGPLMALAGMLVVFRTSAILFGRDTATRAAWFLLAMPLLAVGSVIMTPDTPSVLFFGLVILSLAELDRSQNPKWWLAVGVSAGLGLTAKYTNFFAGATVLLWLTLVPKNRRWFAAPELWLGGLIALLIFAPVLFWNARHGWSSFAKQFGRVGDPSGFNPTYVAEVFAGLLGLASPLIVGLAAFGLVHIVRRAWQTGSSRDWLIASSVLPMLGYFLAHSLHGRVQANWLAPLYPPLAISAAVGLSAIRDAALRARIGRAAVAIGLGSILVIFTHAVHPFANLKKDPAAQMRGWPAFAKSVDKMRQEHGAAWLAVSHYTTAGELAFALKDGVPIVPLNERIRYQHLAAFPAPAAAQPALYVELERRVNEAALRTCFANVKKLGNIAREDRNRILDVFSTYLVTEMQPNCQLDALSSGPLRTTTVP